MRVSPSGVVTVVPTRGSGFFQNDSGLRAGFRASPPIGSPNVLVAGPPPRRLATSRAVPLQSGSTAGAAASGSGIGSGGAVIGAMRGGGALDSTGGGMARSRLGGSQAGSTSSNAGRGSNRNASSQATRATCRQTVVASAAARERFQVTGQVIPPPAAPDSDPPWPPQVRQNTGLLIFQPVRPRIPAATVAPHPPRVRSRERYRANRAAFITIGSTPGGTTVNPFKVIGWLGMAIAVIGAFVEFQYQGLLLVLLGLIGGYAIAAEDHVRVLVSALVLSQLAGVLMNIPEIGHYLTAIFSGAGLFAAGASITIITRNIWRRYKP